VASSVVRKCIMAFRAIYSAKRDEPGLNLRGIECWARRECWIARIGTFFISEIDDNRFRDESFVVSRCCRAQNRIGKMSHRHCFLACLPKFTTRHAVCLVMSTCTRYWRATSRRANSVVTSVGDLAWRKVHRLRMAKVERKNGTHVY